MMAETTKPTSTTTKPEFTHGDLFAARAEVAETLKLVEADRAKMHASQVKRARVERKLHEEARAEGLPFDPSDLPPLYAGDPELHQRFHGLHYEVAGIEKALNVNQEPPPRR